MFKIDTYMNDLISLLQGAFGERLQYVGLQGSYLRNEANENSDIDVMLVIRDFSIRDMDTYRNILISIGYFDKSCGFICGSTELANWNPLEICQLIHTAKDYYGRLEDFVPAYTNEDVRNYVKLSLNNLFHALCHRYIHSGREKNIAKLPVDYKSVFFIIQNMYYLSSGIFIATKQELMKHIRDEDRMVMEMAMNLKSDTEYDFEDAFRILFAWCQEAIARI